eukprot:2012206-Lingulodinium_polyedra.AAC.1
MRQLLKRKARPGDCPYRAAKWAAMETFEEALSELWTTTTLSASMPRIVPTRLCNALMRQGAVVSATSAGGRATSAREEVPFRWRAKTR